MAPAHEGRDLEGCGVEQAYAVLRTVAGLHAAFWQSPRLDELWWAWPVNAKPQRSQKRYRESRPAFDRLFRNRLPEHVFTLLDWLDEHGIELHRRVGDLPRTLLHVDLRLDNLFFSDTTGDAEVTLIDWQTPGLGPAAFDVARFMGGSLRDDVSLEDERRLLKGYHDCLAASGVPDYPFEALQHHYDLCMVLGLRTMVSNVSIVDWGQESGVQRRDLALRRRAVRLSRVSPANLLP